jgi:small subunit ribosomal protein S5
MIGEKNMVWPGLNSPIVQGKELVKQRVLPDNPDYKANLVKMRDTRSSFKFTRLSPLERGWSGGKMPGRKIGRPDPVGEGITLYFNIQICYNKCDLSNHLDDFEGFETIILEV